VPSSYHYYSKKAALCITLVLADLKTGNTPALLQKIRVGISEILNMDYYKMLSYRRETALQGALQFSPKVKDWNSETIFYGHYTSVFNHCDIIGLKICQIP